MTDDELRAIADRCGKHIGQISILATLTALREVRCGKCGGDYSVEHARVCNPDSLAVKYLHDIKTVEAERERICQMFEDTLPLQCERCKLLLIEKVRKVI